MYYMIPVMIAVLALSSPLVTSPARAADQAPLIGPRAFVGLWEGIDPFDGSLQRLSITCADDMTCDVRLTDSFFTDCEGETGFAQGEGIIEDGALSVSAFMLTCNNGETLEDSELFVPDFANGTLINLDARSDISPPTAFHKISQ